MLVNIALVSLGSPDSRTTWIAAATTADTLSLVPPPGATLKATIMCQSLRPSWSRPLPVTGLLACRDMAARGPLPFDPIQRATELWTQRIGPADAMAAATSVMRVHQIVLAAVDPALKPFGLTFARYEALVLLSFSRQGRLPMRVMGERLQLHPTSVTNIVDRLEAGDLVRRTPHPTDGRTTLVAITGAGRAVLEEATKAVAKPDFGLVGLTADEFGQLTALLTKVRQAAGDFD